MIYAADFIHGQNSNSSIFNSISLASGNGGGGDSNLVNYCPELIMFRLGVLSASGELSGCIPIIWREGAGTKLFG